MTRRLALAASLTLLLAAPRLVSAQQGPSTSAPAARQQPAQVKTIYDYKTELSLEETQIGKLKSTLGAFAKDTGTKRDELVKVRQEYAKLVADHGALDLMKVKLQQIGALEFDLRWLDVSTSRTIEGILTTEQLTKWRALQAEARKPKK